MQFLTTALAVDAAKYSGDAFYAESIDADSQRVNRLLYAAASEGVDVAYRSLSANELWNLLSEEETLVIALVDHNLLYGRAAASPSLSQRSSRAPSRASSYASDLASLAASGSVKDKVRTKIGSRSASCVDLASLGEDKPQSSSLSHRRRHPVPTAGGLTNGFHTRGRPGNSRSGSRTSSHADLASLAVASSQQEVQEDAALRASPPFAGHYVLILGVDDVRNGFLINDPANDDERSFVSADALEAARRANGTDEDLLLVPIYQESQLSVRSSLMGNTGCDSMSSKIHRCLRRLEEEVNGQNRPPPNSEAPIHAHVP